MSYVGNVEKDQTFTLSAGASITGYQVVALDPSVVLADDFLVKNSDAGVSFPLGVVQTDDNVLVLAGEQVTVRLWGVTKAIASGAIAIGAQLYGDALGRVTSSSPGTGRWAVGIALTAAAQLGDEILMFLLQEMNEA